MHCRRWRQRVQNAWDHVGSESRQLSIVGSKILGTSILPTIATTNSTTRKFSRNGGFDFTTLTKYNCHYT
ncbi:hypothetical protein CR513_31511, partial [Mucuna pruriens]